VAQGAGISRYTTCSPVRRRPARRPRRRRHRHRAPVRPLRGSRRPRMSVETGLLRRSPVDGEAVTQGDIPTTARRLDRQRRVQWRQWIHPPRHHDTHPPTPHAHADPDRTGATRHGTERRLATGALVSYGGHTPSASRHTPPRPEPPNVPALCGNC
jgi:hypothetical protein